MGNEGARMGMEVGMGRQGLGSAWTCQEPRAQPGSRPPVMHPRHGRCPLQNVSPGPGTSRGPQQPGGEVLSPLLSTDGGARFPTAGGPRPTQGGSIFCSPHKHPLLTSSYPAISRSPFAWPLAFQQLCPVRSQRPVPPFHR